MQYLSTKGVVHRDLAARNILLCKSDGKLVAKIGDFGLARKVQEKYGHYRTYRTKRWNPTRWTAPVIRCQTLELNFQGSALQ